jgi:hypothetical protein
LQSEFFDAKKGESKGNKKMNTGTNPTTSIHSANVVNFYNAAGSLARFENK